MTEQQDQGKQPKPDPVSAASDPKLKRPVARGDGQPPVAERITIALGRKADEDLRTLQERTNLSKTDIANRAIIVYLFIANQLEAGKELYVKDPETGETQLIRFFL